MARNNLIVRCTLSDSELADKYQDYLYRSEKTEREVISEALKMYLIEENDENSMYSLV